MQNILNRIIKYNIYVLVFLLPLFWLPFSFEIFEYNKQYLLFFLSSLALFAWILKQVVYDKEIRCKKSPIDYLVLGFLFISLISAIFSVDKDSSFLGFYGRFSNGFIGLLSFGALYFLITNNASFKEDEKSKFQIAGSKLLNLFLWSTGITVFTGYLSIFGLWTKLGSLITLPQIMLQRTFNPIAGSLEGLAVFLAVAIVLLTGLLLNRTKIFYWLLLFSSLGLLVIINFTSAWMILLAAMILVMALSLAKRIFKENVNRLLLPIFLIIVSAALLIGQPFKTNLPKEQVLPQPVSWRIAFESATDNVKNGFLGTGLGTFHYDFSKYKPQSFNQSWMWQIRFDRASSYLAELLGTIGFVGFFAYLGMLVLFSFVSWFLISKDFAGFPLVVGFIGIIASQFVYYQNTSLSYIFWLILGLAVVSWREKSPALVSEKKVSFKNFPESSLIFLTVVIVFGVAILALYFYGVRYYLADTNYYKALMLSGEQRLQSMQKAVSQNPSLANYRATFARIYLVEALNEKDSAKIQLLVARAIDQARSATIISPNNVANWETLGIVYREIRGVAAGATDWGIKSFESAIELEPANPALYTELGKLHLASGNKEKARDNFSKALEKKTNYESATIQLALLLEQDNIIDEAITRLEGLIRDNPYNVDAHFQLGRLYFNNKRTDESIDQFKTVIILVPNHSNAHYSLGLAYAVQKKTRLAVQEFEKVLELNPDNPDVINKLKELGAR